MITCTVRYEIDPDKLSEFEIYAKAWLHLVAKLGGTLPPYGQKIDKMLSSQIKK